MAGGANAGTIKARLILENSDFRRGMQQAKQDMQDLKNKTGEMKRSSHEFNQAMLGVGAGIVAMVGASIASAARFEQAMAKVKAISGATGSDFERLKQTAIELGNQTQYSATEAAQGMSLLAAAGYKTNDIIAAMPGLLNLAGAAELDLATSADYLTSIMAGFNLKAKDSAHAVDVLVQAMNDANTDLPDMAEAMKYVGPIAGQLGISLEDTASAIALMSNYGIKGSQAGTTLRMAFTRLISPTAKAKKLMEDYGISLRDANGHLKPFPELIEHLHDKLGKLTKEQRQQFLTTLVGVEAMTGFSVLVDQGGDKLAAFSNKLKNADGAAKNFAATMKDTLMGQWEQFTSALDTLGINIGTQLMPEAKDLLSFATDFVNALSQVNPQVVEFGLKLAACAGGALMLQRALAAIPRIIRTVELAMGPEGWLALGIGALVGVIWDYNDAMEASKKVDLSKAESMQQANQQLEAQTKRYEELRGKLKLSSDEMLRYMDLQKLVQTETNPEVIRRYQEEMGRLQKKSGLTNDELQEVIKLNNDLVQKIPTASTAVSSYGNQWAKTTDQIRQFNKEQREALRQELTTQKDKADAGISDAGTKLADAAREFKELETLAEKWRQIRMRNLDQIEKKEKQLNDARKRGDQDAINRLTEEISLHQVGVNTANEELAIISSKKEKQQEIINAQIKEVGNAQQVYEKLIALEYAEAGIVYQRGQGVKQLDDEIAKTQKLLDQKQKEANADGKVTAEEQKQIQALADKLAKQREARQRVADLVKQQEYLRQQLLKAGVSADLLNKILGKPANKQVHVDPNGKGKAKANEIHNTASKPATKNTTVKDNGTAAKVHAAATKSGTKNVKVDDRGTANKLHSNATKSGSKNVTLHSSNFGSWLADIVRPVVKYVRLFANWVGDDPYGTRHSGGTVHELPRYHTGGIVDPQPSTYGRLGTPPKFDEVDVRLLRNEMVLTASQQANLFRMIQTFDYATAQRFREMTKPREERTGNVVIQIGSMTVREEADIRKIAQELERQTRIRQRARGEYL